LIFAPRHQRRYFLQEHPLGKILFALLTAVIAWFLFKGLSKQPRRTESDTRVKEKARAGKAVEHMVKCGVCGVFMPESESATIDGNIACRDPQSCAHRRAS
jgi:hypothetical protein